MNFLLIPYTKYKQQIQCSLKIELSFFPIQKYETKKRGAILLQLWSLQLLGDMFLVDHDILCVTLHNFTTFFDGSITRKKIKLTRRTSYLSFSCLCKYRATTKIAAIGMIKTVWQMEYHLYHSIRLQLRYCCFVIWPS